MQPSMDSSPVVAVVERTPSQRSRAVADPKAASIVEADGLQPRSALLEVVPVAVTKGAVISTFQLMVRDAVPVLPQRSTAIHERVWECMQPSMDSSPVVAVAV